MSRNNSPPSKRTGFKHSIHKLILIDEKNRRCPQYFRSPHAIKMEKERHMYSRYYYIVHPLSRVAVFWEMFRMILYIALVIFKPLDASFIRWTPKDGWSLSTFPKTIIVLDALVYINIGFTFFLGQLDEGTGHVELSPKKIAQRNFNSFLVFDVLSSLPKYLICWDSCHKWLRITMSILSLLKVYRIRSLFLSIRHAAFSLGIKSQEMILVLMFMVIMLCSWHLMTCLTFAVPRYTMQVTNSNHSDSWVAQHALISESTVKQYFTTFFICALKTVGMRVRIFISNNIIGVILAVINYLGGAIMILSMWVGLLCLILANRALNIKYKEMNSQVRAYLKHKQLPPDLRHRIILYYRYKYQNKYFREAKLHDMLSTKLNRAVMVHKCKTLIRNVTLFAELSEDAVENIVSRFVCEIFLPNDMITQSGNVAVGIYFLESGTVAVYTHSGVEAYHMQDGEFFGETGVLLEGTRCAFTTVAIETCKLYRLDTIYFVRYIASNPDVREKLISLAHRRMEIIRKLEDEYKRNVFLKTYASTSPSFGQ